MIVRREVAFLQVLPLRCLAIPDKQGREAADASRLWLFITLFSLFQSFNQKLMNRKKCPYCGEEILLVAKKCRFCGEWLSEEQAVLNDVAAQNIPATIDCVDSVEIPVVGEMSQPPATINHAVPTSGAPQSATVMSNQQPNQGLQQNIVVQPQIVIEQEVTQNQEQTVIIENSGAAKSEANGCLWTQLVLISIGLGFVFKGFWYGVAAMIILAIAVFMPFVGPVLCVISGVGFGALAGIISVSLGAPTWVGWLVGIISAVGLVTMNLEQRESEKDD